MTERSLAQRKTCPKCGSTYAFEMGVLSAEGKFIQPGLGKCGVCFNCMVVWYLE